MDAPAKYLRELRSELGHYPTWMPGAPIALGTFGVFVRGVFRREGQLEDLGISFQTLSGAAAQSYEKHRGMSFRAKAQFDGRASALDAALGVDVHIENGHAWAFAVTSPRTHQIDDILRVKQAVLEARRVGRWRDEWLLVTQVERVSSLTVLVAKGRKSRGRIHAKGELEAAANVLLAQELTLGFESDEVFSVVGKPEATASFDLHKVRGAFTGRLVPISGGDGADTEPGLEPASDESMFPEEAE